MSNFYKKLPLLLVLTLPLAAFSSNCTVTVFGLNQQINDIKENTPIDCKVFAKNLDKLRVTSDNVKCTITNHHPTFKLSNGADIQLTPGQSLQVSCNQMKSFSSCCSNGEAEEDYKCVPDSVCVMFTTK